MIWTCYRDPARPTWPGVLIAPSDHHAFISVEVGHPPNCADSLALAERLAAFLSSEIAARETDRTIRVPQRVVDRAAHGPYEGIAVIFPVQVDWPELRLTEAQIIENAMATVAGEPTPHPDRSIFMVEVPYAVVSS